MVAWPGSRSARWSCSPSPPPRCARRVGAVAGSVVVAGRGQVAGPFLLIAAGETEISSSLAGILVASAPIFTALLAIRFDQEERSEGSRLLGVAIGVVGVVALFGRRPGRLRAPAARRPRGARSRRSGTRSAGSWSSTGSPAARRSASPPGCMAAALLLLPAALARLPAAAPGLGPSWPWPALGVVGTGIAFVIFYG